MSQCNLVPGQNRTTNRIRSRKRLGNAALTVFGISEFETFSGDRGVTVEFELQSLPCNRDDHNRWGAFPTESCDFCVTVAHLQEVKIFAIICILQLRRG